MKINKFIIAFIVLSIGGTALIFRQLPDTIALHFNVIGEVDRWGGKASVWITSAIPLVVYLLMTIVPNIDPRHGSFNKHMKAYTILINTLTLFLISLNWFIILYSMGLDLNIRVFVLSGLGILFIVLGNYLPNVRQNYTFGIRTPWTLDDEQSWRKTHRVGGIGFILTGIIGLITAWLPGLPAFIIFLSAVVLLISGLLIYSYRIYMNREINK